MNKPLHSRGASYSPVLVVMCEAQLVLREESILVAVSKSQELSRSKAHLVAVYESL